MSLCIAFYFLPAIFIFTVLLVILLYCKYRCIRESGREAGPLDQAVVPQLFIGLFYVYVKQLVILCQYHYIRRNIFLFSKFSVTVKNTVICHNLSSFFIILVILLIFVNS